MVIRSGVVAAGLSGFYVQFFNGLIVILALLGHRWNQKRYRQGPVGDAFQPSNSGVQALAGFCASSEWPGRNHKRS